MASGENRVSKPYPACPRLPNVSFIYNNIMNYDYNISDIYSITIIYMIVILKADEIYIYLILSYLITYIKSDLVLQPIRDNFFF